jgi:hypothetical protein
MQLADLAPAVGIGCHGDHGRDRDDAAAFALLQVSGVKPQIPPLAGKRPVEERIDLPAFAGAGSCTAWKTSLCRSDALPRRAVL